MIYNLIFFYTGCIFWVILALAIILTVIILFLISVPHLKQYIALKYLIINNISLDETRIMRMLFDSTDIQQSDSTQIVNNIIKIKKVLENENKKKNKLVEYLQIIISKKLTNEREK